MTAPGPVSITRDGSVAVLTIDNPPVNAASHAVRAGLLARLAEATANPAVEAVVIVGAGRTFVAGADIREFGRPAERPTLTEVCDAIEASPKPVVAAITGTALGGGIEIALAAHARIAAPDAKVGLPEVKLGIIPGAGGTQRLPRLAGVPAAIELVTSGRILAAEEARRLGVVDRLADDPLAAAIALAPGLGGAAPHRRSTRAALRPRCRRGVARQGRRQGPRSDRPGRGRPRGARRCRPYPSARA